VRKKNPDMKNEAQKPKLPFEMDIILDAFQLETVLKSELLDNWTNFEYALNESDKNTIDKLSKNYEREGDYWNEEELKVRFIAIILQLVNIDEPGKIKAFLERNISTEIDEYLISVNVDLMFASQIGKNTPTHPYFFLQELKKGKKSANDPEAQMLAAMLASQKLNNDGKPIYGAYQVGRNWIFTILEGKNYHISEQYDVAKPEKLTEIIYILKRIKDLVL
jgi:hypothetical protein